MVADRLLHERLVPLYAGAKARARTAFEAAMTIVPLATVPEAAVERLLDRAFGPERRQRTAYRVRAGTEAVEAFSFAALDASGSLLGIIQTWPVLLATDSGARVPMMMIGPVAVEPAIQRGGVGRALVARMLEAADASTLEGADALMLIGDPEYYGRFFGFSDAATARWRLPGPFEPRRLLARGAGVEAAAGEVRSRPPADQATFTPSAPHSN